MLTPDREGRFDDIVLGYDSFDGYVNDRYYCGSTVGPFANRIAGGQFMLDGDNHKLSLNENGENYLHGGAHGFSTKNWNLLASSPKLRFGLSTEHDEQEHLANMQVEVSFELTADNRLIIEHTAKANKPTPISLTCHPYFNLTGQHDVSIANHRLQINAEHVLALDDKQIPTGELVPVKDTDFDFNRAERIERGLSSSAPAVRSSGGYDHCWVLNKTEARRRADITLSEPMSGRAITINTTLPSAQVYSANAFDGSVLGKKEKRLDKHCGIAIEPQFFPDSPNHEHFPDCILRPGHTYQHRHEIGFTTYDSIKKNAQ